MHPIFDPPWAWFLLILSVMIALGGLWRFTHML